MTVATEQTEVVQPRIRKHVLAAFREPAERRGVELDTAWTEAAAAWAGMDEEERRERDAWRQLGKGLFSGPHDTADRHDDYVYGPR